MGETGENRQHRENVKRRQERWTKRKNTRGQRWKERRRRRRRRSIRRRCSFLLWKSFQNGVHLLRNGRQRKLKLVLRGDKGGEQKKGGKLKTDTKEPKLLESRMDYSPVWIQRCQRALWQDGEPAAPAENNNFEDQLWLVNKVLQKKSHFSFDFTSWNLFFNGVSLSGSSWEELCVTVWAVICSEQHQLSRFLRSPPDSEGFASTQPTRASARSHSDVTWSCSQSVHRLGSGFCAGPSCSSHQMWNKHLFSELLCAWGEHGHVETGNRRLENCSQEAGNFGDSGDLKVRFVSCKKTLLSLIYLLWVGRSSQPLTTSVGIWRVGNAT